MILLGSFYNDFHGADMSCFIRNILNAAGFTVFASSAAVVASTPSSLNHAAYPWFGIIALVVFSAVHVQDMQDQEGDRDRGRQTVPLVIGDQPTRMTIAVGVMIWSFVAPAFWNPSIVGYIAPCCARTSHCLQSFGILDSSSGQANVQALELVARQSLFVTPHSTVRKLLKALG